MKRIILISSFMIFCLKSYSQSILSGKVTDADSGEPLIGASVIYGSGLGVSTDFDGNYSIKISNDEINVKVSYIGYKTIEKTITKIILRRYDRRRR